jgi:hypothetical protein
MKNKLKIVGGPGCQASLRANVKVDVSGQYFMDFNESKGKRIIIIPISEIHGNVLFKEINTYKPTVFIDVRHTTRFDIPNCNRNIFFRWVSMQSALYTRCPMEMGIRSGGPLSVDYINIDQRVEYEILHGSSNSLMLLTSSRKKACGMMSIINYISARKGVDVEARVAP